MHPSTMGEIALAAAAVVTAGVSLRRRKAPEQDHEALVQEVIKVARAEQTTHEAAHHEEHGAEDRPVHYDEGQRREAIRQRVLRELANLKITPPKNLQELLK